MNILEKTQPRIYNKMNNTERIDYASKEAIAEFCSQMLEETDLVDKIYKANRSAGQKLIDFLKKVIANIREKLGKKEAESEHTQATKNSEMSKEEAQALKELADDYQSIVDKWEKAVAKGNKVQNIKTATEQKNNTADNSDVKNSFAGREAKIANMSLLEQAVQMENNSEDTETIRKKTGWFRGYDGKWRFEIDDSKMRINESDKEYLKKSGSTLLGYFITHEKLFEAYPELKDLMIYTKYINSYGDAYYSPESKSITIDTNSLNSLSDTGIKKLLIHEIQHAIQDIESFTTGASTSDFFTYLKTAGEIEAYDTSDRIYMTAEQRINTRPDIDRSDVVFSEDDTVAYYIKFSHIDEESQQNAISRGDIVIKNKDGLFNAIEDSLQHKNLKNNYIISALPKEVKDKIISDTNSTVFKKGSYVVKISSDDIRHINEHFHNKDDIIRAIYRLYDVICNYDTVSVLKIGQQNRLKFEKSYADFDYLSIEIASKKKRCLDLVTFYITKNNKKKKGKIQSPAKNNNLAHQGVSPSTTNIPQNGTSVNNNSMQKRENNSDFKKFQSRISDLDNKYLNAVENNDLYQARDFSYENIDLSTLDDNELKVYNRRGWANELFTKEDRVLLNEKFNELNSKSSQRTDNVLGDGSRVVEINNKIVLIGGTFEEPIIHGVFVINTDNETEANIYKEIILNEYDEYKQGKHQFASICELFESVLGNKNVRNYESTDFRYYKGRKDSGERAILPHSFKSYGYTKQFQDGTGVNTETERSISDEINSEKYQERYDPMSNRELLANALETTAKTSREKSNLRAYKEGLESLNKDSERLSLAIARGHAGRN